MRFCLPIFGCCAALLWFGNAEAQDAFAAPALIYSTDPKQTVVKTADTVFTVQEITVSGNKRTRRSTVLREVPFQPGKTYPFSQIVEKLELTRQLLMNTGLFRNVTANLQGGPDQRVTVAIALEEKWYFYPQPFVRLANGSFSQWNDRGRPLDHLNYGIRFTQENFSGRGDRLHLHLAEGYTKKIALQYRGFFFDKALKWSGSLNLVQGMNREINYATENNKVLAVKNPDGFLFKFFQSWFDLVYRPAIRTRHQFSVGYNYNRVADTVRKLNKNYSPDDKVYAFPYISYGVSFIDFDFNPYPTRGRYADASLYKAGLNGPINLWQLSAKAINYWPLGRKAFFSLRVAGLIKFPFDQPYTMQGFMGYGDAFLQGYENYIIDGVAGGLSKQTLGLNVVNTAIPLPTIKWLKSLRSIPVRAYLKAYANEGYAYHPNPGATNRLTNRMLYSTGIGLDLILFTDTIFRFEYSFNRMGERGLFLHQ